jgi:hypothetical protein
MEETLNCLVMLIGLIMAILLYMVVLLVNHFAEEWEESKRVPMKTEWQEADYRGVVVNDETDEDGYSNNAGAWVVRTSQFHTLMTWKRPGDELPRIRSGKYSSF